jgi:predicted RNA methylase
LKLGVNTRGRFELSEAPDNFKYSTLSYKQIFVILERLQIGVSDVFYDLGCGKGRVLCAAQVLGPQKIVGVEINQELAKIARGNLKKLRGLKNPFEIINRSAVDCDYQDATVFYLYNPFGRNPLEQVLINIKKSLAINPRKIKIAYVNANFNELFKKSDWLILTDTWERYGKYPFIPYTTFWESKLF